MYSDRNRLQDRSNYPDQYEIKYRMLAIDECTITNEIILSTPQVKKRIKHGV